MNRTPPARLVSFMERARNGLGTLRKKMVPPDIALLEFVTGMWSFQIVYAIAELGIADSLRDGPVDSDALAARHDVDRDALYRLLRAATSQGVFKELDGRRFELNALGGALCSRDTGTARAFILMMGRLGWPHWGELLSCVRNGRTAIENRHGVAPFEFLGADEQTAATFNAAMTGMSAATVAPVVAAYDFGRADRVVDVGGGHGRLLAGILARHAHTSGALFDLPDVVAGAPPLLAELGVVERCECVGGSFFEAGAIPAGDLHILKSVIHDWDDHRAGEILTNVREAADKKGLVLLCETVVTGPNRPHLSKLLDIEMLVHAGGRERTADEYGALLANSGLRLRRVIPTASPLSLVEATVA